MIDAKKLKEILKVVIKHRVKRLKTTDFEIELFEAALVHGHPVDRPRAAPQMRVVEEPETPMPSDEDFLYWSSGFDPAGEKKGGAA